MKLVEILYKGKIAYRSISKFHANPSEEIEYLVSELII